MTSNELTLRPSHSNDTLSLYQNQHGDSNSPSYYTESDSNLSTGSSNGSMKRRRRSTRLNSNEYHSKTDKKIAFTQKKFKNLDLAISQRKFYTFLIQHFKLIILSLFI